MLLLKHLQHIVRYRSHRTIGTRTQLEIKVNQGSFPDNSSAYLYVVDAGGNVSPGTKITFGSSSAGSNDLNPPPAPDFSIANVVN